MYMYIQMLQRRWPPSPSRGWSWLWTGLPFKLTALEPASVIDRTPLSCQLDHLDSMYCTNITSLNSHLSCSH